MIHVSRLSLTNFRNYTQLELELLPKAIVLQGDNAQGKTNLLEAIYFLSTSRSQRATLERELISWDHREEPAVARVEAQVHRKAGDIKVEITLMDTDSSPGVRVNKRIKINGVPRRAVDLVGQVNVVLFSSRDIDLIGGAPSERRRYLDLANSQVDSRYLRALQRYNKVLLQRNNLLRLLAEGRAKADQLDFWDQELVEHGSYLITQRQAMITELNELAYSIHQHISSGERLRINYLPSVSAGDFQERLGDMRGREIARGMSLTGPHRDDLEFLAGDINMGVFGSRGQQRTIALSIRLAESGYLRAKTGDEPILLLDDVLSELDAVRREHLLSSVLSYQQVLITSTELDHFAHDFLSEAAVFGVSGGTVAPYTSEAV